MIDTSKESVADVLAREEAAGHPLNLAIDCLGSEKVGECFPHVAYGCRWIMIATLAGDITPVNLRTMFMKNIRLIGSTLRSRTAEEKSRIMKALQTELWPLFTAGKLVSNIHAVFPIAQVEEAHAVLRRSENIGKVVLTLR